MCTDGLVGNLGLWNARPTLIEGNRSTVEGKSKKKLSGGLLSILNSGMEGFLS